MNKTDLIATPGVFASGIKAQTGLSKIHLESSSNRLSSAKSIACRQGEGEDPTICDRIRQAIVADKGLSLNAQNIEISVCPGGVILDGSVKSPEERHRIESGAASVIKDGKVFSRLVIRLSHASGQPTFLRPQERNEEQSAEQKCDRIRHLWRTRKGSRTG